MLGVGPSTARIQKIWNNQEQAKRFMKLRANLIDFASQVLYTYAMANNTQSDAYAGMLRN